MAVPSSLTENYDALVSQTLKNIITGTDVVDNISTDDPYLFMVMRQNPDGYERVESMGNQAQANLMYALQDADTYSGYDTLNTTPIDGVTAAFWSWRQAAAPISINRFERRQNSGENQIVSMLATKTEQAIIGMKEFFAKSILRGNGDNVSTAIETAFTSASNGSVFVDPLPKFVQDDPTSDESVGNINQSTYSWWQNKQSDCTDTSNLTQLNSLETMFNDVTKGVGGPPNFHLVDQSTYEWYNLVLWQKYQNPTTQRADFPFETLNYHGRPVAWSQYVPNFTDGKIANEAADGSWLMLNTKFIKIKVDSGTDFITTDFVRPADQDASVAHILWYGAHTISNRAKQGLVASINTAQLS